MDWNKQYSYCKEHFIMDKTTIKRQLWATALLGVFALGLGALALYNYFDEVLRAYFFR